MTATRLPCLGSIVWAELDDPNGFRKLRPAVVVSPTIDIVRGKPIVVAAITTRVPDPLPDDYVLLPWNPQGIARSGLRRRCAAVASWLCTVLADEVRLAGILPPAVIAEVLAKIKLNRPPDDRNGDAE